MNGKFIVFEGIDGSGKTTQLSLLGEDLADRGYPVVLTREPGGTRVGESIREILLDPRYNELAPWSEALLYAAARAQHVAQIIAPALRSGSIVLCDRFLDSSLAYQGYGRGLDLNMLEQINQPALAGVAPDLTLLLDFSIDEGIDRLSRSGRKADRIELEKSEFYRKVREGYLVMAGNDPDRHRVIDASRPSDQVQREILRAVEEILHAPPAGNSRS